MKRDVKPHVLCVDDEPHVLDGLKTNLRREYDVSTAEGGEAALAALESDGPFAVVLSDMRMPGMDGAKLLSQVRDRAPDTVRMLLTGHADVDTAIHAVNEGEIFRFLTKPCPPDRLREILGQGVEQHRLVTAQRVLLEDTLRGSVEALTETLAMADPVAFGRASRIKALAGELAADLGLEDRWQVEVAAMLSRVASITLPEDVAAKLRSGRLLTSDERQMVARLPEAAIRLIASIPRLEGVRGILRRLALGARGCDDSTDGRAAAVLRAVIEYDSLCSQGIDEDVALSSLKQREPAHDTTLVDRLAAVTGRSGAGGEVREVALADMREGMVLAADLLTQGGALLVSAGHEVTAVLLERLKNFRGHAVEPVRVVVPSEGTPAHAATRSPVGAGRS